MTWQPLSHQDYVHACWESTFKHRVTFTSHLALSPWWLWKHHSDTNANPACFLSSQFLTFVLLVLHLCVSIARAHVSTATPTWNSTPGRLVHCPQTKRLLSVLALPATFNMAGMTQTRKRLTRRQPLSTAFRSPTATKACSQSSSAQTRRGCSWHPVWCLDAAGSAPELSQASGIRQKHFPLRIPGRARTADFFAKCFSTRAFYLKAKCSTAQWLWYPHGTFIPQTSELRHWWRITQTRGDLLLNPAAEQAELPFVVSCPGQLELFLAAD